MIAANLLYLSTVYPPRFAYSENEWRRGIAAHNVPAYIFPRRSPPGEPQAIEADGSLSPTASGRRRSSVLECLLRSDAFFISNQIMVWPESTHHIEV